MSEFKYADNVDRRGTGCVKWDFMPKDAPKDLIPMWIADMDIKCADEIVEAVKKCADAEIYGYSSYHANTYFKILQGWYERQYDHHIPERSMILGVTVVSIFSYIIRLLTKPGEGVLIQSPVYPPFAGQISGTERKVITNNLINRGGHYEIDFDDFETKMADENTKGFLLCSPHNPVGRMWTSEELGKMVAICKKYDKWIIADEIHCDLGRSGNKHIPTESVDPSYKHRIFTCYSSGKTFNLAGLGICHIVIHDDDFRAKLDEYLGKHVAMARPTPFATAATEAAFSKGDAWLAGLRKHLDGNAQFIADFLAERLPKVKYTVPEATYLAWLDFREYGLSDEALHEKLMQESRVWLNEGHSFGANGSGFMRLNFGCSRELLEEGLGRIAETFA